jgi:hypothetical protein
MQKNWMRENEEDEEDEEEDPLLLLQLFKPDFATVFSSFSCIVLKQEKTWKRVRGTRRRRSQWVLLRQCQIFNCLILELSAHYNTSWVL